MYLNEISQVTPADAAAVVGGRCSGSIRFDIRRVAALLSSSLGEWLSQSVNRGKKMDMPNLNSVIETFIQIDLSDDVPAIAIWQRYLGLLRSHVAPLVRNFLEEGVISWYSFLVHGRESGVPTSEVDNGMYLHLRMALRNPTAENELLRRLPNYCVMTRKMEVPNPPSLDTADINFLVDSRVELGWKILGESSEWVLQLLDSHDPQKPVPPQNVAQFLHYLGNQLFVRVVQIPMP